MKTRLEEIRSEIESRIPGAFRCYDRSAASTTTISLAGVAELGIPIAGLTQICAPPGVSTGSTSLMVALLAQFTSEDRYCALVDPSDCFDPEGAESAGVALDRLLWVRCSGHANAGSRLDLKPLETAFKACDILLQDGSFRMIAMDLLDIEEQALRKVPLTTWFRLSRVVEKTETSLLFLMPYPAARSCASLTLQASTTRNHWRNIHGEEETGKNSSAAHTVLLDFAEHEFEIIRDRNGKTPQPAKISFVTKPQWGP